MAWLQTVVDVPAPAHGVASHFWAQALDWPVGRPWDGHPELSSFVPADGDPYVHLQQIDGPPRVHIDVESDDPTATIDAAARAGAEVVLRTEMWVAMRSPGGLPFCVIQARERTAPEPVTWPGDHRSRLVQVCIDSPRSKHEGEVAFWQAVLPGRWTRSGSAEFAGKWHDDAGSPLQLLFQRLEEPDGDVRAHWDLGTDDLAAEVRRLLDLGAEDLGAGHGGWHVLRDPAGLVFCVTENSPDQAIRRDLE